LAAEEKRLPLPATMKTKRVWTAPKLKEIPIFFEVSLYAGTR
jgi:hypothetical protein